MHRAYAGDVSTQGPDEDARCVSGIKGLKLKANDWLTSLNEADVALEF